jgi:hypothetical protein
MKNKLHLILAGSFLFTTFTAHAQFGAAILDGVLKGISSSGRGSSSEDKQYAKDIYDAKVIFPEVSRIQLRAIQTRKFKKSSTEVVSAIKSMCADANGQFSNMNSITCVRRTSMGGGMFSINDKPGIYKLTLLKYEVDSNPSNNTETTVRLRINWLENDFDAVLGNGSKQTTNAIFYQTNFKELADGLFIDAIELSPAEMQ